LSFLYRWTFSYYVKGPRGTPMYETEYYYNVRTKRRLSKTRYRRIEASLRSRSRRHLKRYSAPQRKKYGATVEAGKPDRPRKAMLERTALERPSRSRRRGEGIEAQAVRMKMKEGRAVPTDLYRPGRDAVEKGKDEDFASFRKRVTTKELSMPKLKKRR